MADCCVLLRLCSAHRVYAVCPIIYVLASIQVGYEIGCFGMWLPIALKVGIHEVLALVPWPYVSYVLVEGT
jgi:hypothetical protein